MRILYASYQTGGVLPGYVKYALLRLARLGNVTLLTNERALENAERKFLEQNGIELFMTVNRGFDFGMWRRYLDCNEEALDSRLVVLNDSVVYYRNTFKELFDRAEASSAEALSLTANNEVSPHLQSFFLYLKDGAVEVFRRHLLETPEQLDFYGAVRNLEIPFLQKLRDVGLNGEALFKTPVDAMFCYPELIAGGCGFVKRKLLQRRFSFMEQQHFAKAGHAKALYANYQKLVACQGVPDSEFDLEWLPSPVDGTLKRVLDRLCQGAFSITYGIYYRFFKKIRDRFRG